MRDPCCQRIHADLPAIVCAARAPDFGELPVTIGHAERLRVLPAHHLDPFDRLLVAQALEERLTIVTHDPLIAAYAVARLWR